MITLRKAFILCALAALTVSSCGLRKEKNTGHAAVPVVSEVKFSGDAIPYFEEGYLARDPISLCQSAKTFEEVDLAAFPTDPENGYYKENTPAEDAFYFPGADIRNDHLARTVQLRYNYAALFYRVLHAYEWFHRMSTGLDDDEVSTKKDTLEWIRHARPRLSLYVVERALPDAKALSHARKLMTAYDRFDGDDSEDSPFSKAMDAYKEGMSDLPELVSHEETRAFEERFWTWYDKKTLVPEIDSLVRMNMKEPGGDKLTEVQLENMRRAILTENEIDRRTILALEYVKFDGWGGTVLLGEILESRIYTKYLLEAWISWRTNVQMCHSPSSFGVIANNYYDRMRAIVLDTMVRHCLQAEDKNAECLIENLIFCDIIHRMGAIAGNTSFNTLMHLMTSEFIHPRLLKEDL